jgi:hypothetical protein
MIDIGQMSTEDLWTFYENLHAELVRKARVELTLLEEREGMINSSLAACHRLLDKKPHNDLL